ncbi:hypothetical protein QUB80_33840 [Chlorogloeopsis sp. ULAP01]|uniref:hypothetical protein n=1 Tax=Chlorogloeopsis sp. ULAP01 TaxID=3056483 RepID=UPI0025AAC9EB|nr:hypothetical protein [Chlorogloeopsis sp. ULAP01]MDM9385640.1 hypothetical protein [Chlorogloeopsis sp. ULAP01]
MTPVALDALNPLGRLRSFMPGNPYFRLSTTLREAGLRPSTCLHQSPAGVSPDVGTVRGKPAKSAASPPQWLQNPRIGISSLNLLFKHSYCTEKPQN